MKKIKLIIDADPLIFQVTEGKYTKMSMFKNESGDVEEDGYKEPLGQYKERFYALVKDIEDEVAVELLGRYKLKGKTKLAFSDPDNNFRYNLLETYKQSRGSGGRSPLFYRLREWAHKKYGYVKNIEADDVAGHYVRKGWVSASFDKDILRGCAGIHFDTYHSRRGLIETSELEAHRFNLIQTLMGDPTDDIPSLPKKKGTGMIPIPDVARQPFKVTEKIAITLLDEAGWDWDGVIKVFEEKGFGEKEALRNRRLIGLDQWTPKKGVRLFKGI